MKLRNWNIVRIIDMGISPTSTRCASRKPTTCCSSATSGTRITARLFTSPLQPLIDTDDLSINNLTVRRARLLPEFRNVRRLVASWRKRIRSDAAHRFRFPTLAVILCPELGSRWNIL